MRRIWQWVNEVLLLGLHPSLRLLMNAWNRMVISVRQPVVKARFSV